MSLTPERTRELLIKAEAVIEGHFVGTSKNHLSLYIAKDRATRLTNIAFELCAGIAERFAGDDIDAVVAPAVGALALSQWTAFHLSRLRPDRPEVVALYAEHEEEVWAEGKGDGKPTAFDPPSDRLGQRIEGLNLFKGEKLVIVKPSFALKRGFDKDVSGKRVLAVEDVLTTGGSAANAVKAILKAGGKLVGLAALVNGGKITAKDLGVDRLETLLKVERQIFTPEECAARGLCFHNVPINTQFGHGAAFLAAKSRGQPA